MKLLKKAAAVITALSVWMTSISSLELTSITASANSSKVHIWDGTIDTSWFTNDKDTYEIYTPEQLAGLNYLTDNASNGGHSDRWQGVTINLMNDIVLNDTANWRNWVNDPPANSWEAIGAVGDPLVKGYCPFAGTFNGNGHTISGLYAKSQLPGGFNPFAGYPSIGLFDYTCGAVIGNFKIEKSVFLGNGGADVGVVVAKSEYSYFDSIEVNDVIIAPSYAGGGIAGACNYQPKFTVLFTYVTMAAMGIFVNPLLFTNSSSEIPAESPVETYRGSVFNNCKISNVEFINIGTTQGSVCAGAVSGSMSGGAIFNCVSENITVSLGEKTSYQAGAMYGGQADEKPVTVKNCYTHNFKLPGNMTQYDKSSVKTVAKDEYISSKFASKLGKGFKYVSNCTPIITSLDKAVYGQKIIKGDFDNSGRFDIADISGLLSACLSDQALDYRTFKASDTNGDGKITILDVQAQLTNLLS